MSAIDFNNASIASATNNIDHILATQNTVALNASEFL
jgi:hypothetical protein